MTAQNDHSGKNYKDLKYIKKFFFTGNSHILMASRQDKAYVIGPLMFFSVAWCPDKAPRGMHNDSVI